MGHGLALERTDNAPRRLHKPNAVAENWWGQFHSSIFFWGGAVGNRGLGAVCEERTAWDRTPSLGQCLGIATLGRMMWASSHELRRNQ